MKRLGNYFKIVISVLAIANLIALFVFEYDFSFFNKMFDGSEEETMEETVATVAPQWEFVFETDPLIYDGTKEFDLLDGVILLDGEGQFSDEEIFVRITTAENLSSKIIEYSADTKDGRMIGTRTLQLLHYQGPSLTWNHEITTVDTKDMNQIKDVLVANGYLTATDGYEADISQWIEATYVRDEANLKLIHCMFTITNMFQDTVTLNVDLTLNLTLPLVVLTESSVIVKKGEFFDPMNYIDVVMDVDGSSLDGRITIENGVDIQTPGTYNVRYFTYNHGWIYSLPQDLQVIVVE